MFLLSYFTSQNTEDNNEAMEQTVMGVYVIQQEGAQPGDDPEDIGVLIESVEVEVLQKLLMNLDEQRLSSKAQFLKNKLMGWMSWKQTHGSQVFFHMQIFFVFDTES